MADDLKPRAKSFNVGGVQLERPFKIRRLGHFGVDVHDMEVSLPWYTENFGIKTSDPIDFGARLPPDQIGKHGTGIGYFMRHGTDHHSFVLFPRRIRKQMMKHYPDKITINQITWQVGSLREVVDGTGQFNS